jgi:hypothetical protein
MARRDGFIAYAKPKQTRHPVDICRYIYEFYISISNFRTDSASLSFDSKGNNRIEEIIRIR